MSLIEITLSFVDIIAMFVDNSLLPAVIVLAVIAIVAIIAGVILLILYIKLRAANKRSWLVFIF